MALLDRHAFLHWIANLYLQAARHNHDVSVAASNAVIHLIFRKYQLHDYTHFTNVISREVEKVDKESVAHKKLGTCWLLMSCVVFLYNDVETDMTLKYYDRFLLMAYVYGFHIFGMHCPNLDIARQAKIMSEEKNLEKIRENMASFAERDVQFTEDVPQHGETIVTPKAMADVLDELYGLREHFKN